MEEKEVEERIKEITVRKGKLWKKRTIIFFILTWMILTFISTYKHPLAYTKIWVITMITLALVMLLMGWFGSFCIFHFIEMNIREEEKASFVRNKLEKSKRVEVKKRSSKHNEFFYDLQKRGKFFATFLNAKEKDVLIVYRYDGEKKDFLYECLEPSEVFEKYTFEFEEEN